MEAFRRAVAAHDALALTALLADDVRVTSPVVFKPYEGKAITAAILRGVLRVFEDLHYERVISSPDGRDHALVFQAIVDGRIVNGCDFLHVNDDGLIDDFAVMVRPLSGAQALATAMGAQFDAILADAAAAAS